MLKITPSEAITKLKGFIDAMDRLEKNEYKSPASRTRDRNAVIAKFKKLQLWYSLAYFNKNQERAEYYMTKANEMSKIYLKRIYTWS